MKTISFSPDDKGKIKQFVRFAKKIYKDDPNWVQPLNMELAGSKLLGVPGLLTSKHPYQKHAETKYFMVKDKGEILGRIAATINYKHNEDHQEKVGFFGFFESVNDTDISDKLFDSASEYLKAKGMEAIRGPASFTLNDVCGLLVNGFDTLPYLDTPYNPQYYQDLIESYGFTKVKDLLAYRIDFEKNMEEMLYKLDRVQKILKKIHDKGRIKIRSIDFDNIDKDFTIIRHIYNEAWKDNWGHDQLTKEDFEIIANNLKKIANPDLIYIGYYDNKPVAFYGIIPNINQLLKKRRFGNAEPFRLVRLMKDIHKIDQMRVMLFGILSDYRRKGIDAYMFAKSFDYGLEIGMKEVEVSWLLEDNKMVIRPTEYWCGELYKIYRMYEKKI